MHLGKDGWGVGLLWEASRAVSLSLSRSPLTSPSLLGDLPAR